MGNPWFPFLEDNQGAISVAALLLALGVALWEQRQANVQRQRQQHAEIQDALLLVDLLEEAVRNSPEEETSRTGVTLGARDAETLVGMVRDMATAHAENPLLALALLQAARAAEKLAGFEESEFEDGSVDELLEDINTARADVQMALDRAERRAKSRTAELKKIEIAMKRLIRLRARNQQPREELN